MSKIVGKLLLSLIIFYVSAACSKIQMRLVTTDGEQLEAAAVGQPFTLEVTIDEVQGSVSPPHIEGLDAFGAKRTGMYMSSINGVSSTKFSYQLRINEAGTYTIGPARMHYQHQEMISNVVKVTVGKESGPIQSSQSKKSAQQSSSKVFLRLLVDKDVVVVGQKITGTLRFFYQDPSVTLANIGQSEITGFDMKKVSAPKGGVMSVNGEQYRYGEWQWDMYPTTSGEFILPAYSADYDIPAKDSHSFAGLFMFFNARAEHKRVYSNAVKITVNPLPYYNETVDAIGTFTSMSATIKPPVAKEGEGIVFAIEIEGDGNWDRISAPALNMPKELKFYESQTVFIPTEHDMLSKKRFEFIVQGLRSGDWEIPEQLFTFFDTEKQAYKTLRTAPLIVSIMPNPLGNHGATADQHQDLASQAVSLEHEDVLVPLNAHGPWYTTPERVSLPWIFFHLLTLFPFLYVLYPWIRKKFFLRGMNMANGRKKRAFKEAKKALKTLGVDGDHTKLYYIFVRLFSECSGQSLGELSHETITMSLRVNGFSESMLNEWDSFFESITQSAFGVFHNRTNSYDLWRMAEQWIARLEQNLL